MKSIKLLLGILLTCAFGNSVKAEVLEGSVQQSTEKRIRIERDPSVDDEASSSQTVSTQPVHKPRRISRENPTSVSHDNIDEQMGAFDTGPNQSPPANINELMASFDNLYQQPNGLFDIGAESNSQELLLAWEKWHKQICKTMYFRTMRRTQPFNESGYASVEITVTRDNRISAKLLSKSGSPTIASAYLGAINSMDGNPGLTFPPKSQRHVVVFKYQFIQAPNITPGYDWKRGDYETVRE